MQISLFWPDRKYQLPVYAPRHRGTSIAPRCELHGCRIVHKLPPSCPFATENPLDALHAMRVGAFSLADKSATLRAGSLMHSDTDVCEECAGTNLTSPTIRQIRAELAQGVA